MAKGKEPAAQTGAASPNGDAIRIVSVAAEGAKPVAGPALLKLNIAARLAGKAFSTETKPLPDSGKVFGASGEGLAPRCPCNSSHLRVAAYLELPGSALPIFDANAAVRYLLDTPAADGPAVGAADTWAEWEATVLAPAVLRGGADLQNVVQAINGDAVGRISKDLTLDTRIKHFFVSCRPLPRALPSKPSSSLLSGTSMFPKTPHSLNGRTLLLPGLKFPKLRLLRRARPTLAVQTGRSRSNPQSRWTTTIVSCEYLAITVAHRLHFI